MDGTSRRKSVLEEGSGLSAAEIAGEPSDEGIREGCVSYLCEEFVVMHGVKCRC